LKVKILEIEISRKNGDFFENEFGLGRRNFQKLLRNREKKRGEEEEGRQAEGS